MPGNDGASTASTAKASKDGATFIPDQRSSPVFMLNGSEILI
jgi:hypothetical protein